MSEWFNRTPQPGDEGRLVLKSNSNITIPVKILRAVEGVVTFDVYIGELETANTFYTSDWIFQIQNPVLPTAFGSVIKSRNGFMVLTSSGWGNYEYAVEAEHVDRNHFDVIFDAGKQGSEIV
jgi:hypothetical protein